MEVVRNENPLNDRVVGHRDGQELVVKISAHHKNVYGFRRPARVTAEQMSAMLHTIQELPPALTLRRITSVGGSEVRFEWFEGPIVHLFRYADPGYKDTPCALSDHTTEWPSHLPDADALIHSLAEALSALHAAGIAHGDVAENNIWVVAPGRVILADFDALVPRSAADAFEQTCAADMQRMDAMCARIRRVAETCSAVEVLHHVEGVVPGKRSGWSNRFSQDGVDFQAGYHSQLLANGEHLSGQRDNVKRVAFLKSHGVALADASVLDLGCNAGGVLAAMRSDIAAGVGIDFDARCIDAAKFIEAQHAERKIQHHLLDFDRDNLARIPVLCPKPDIILLASMGSWVSKWRRLYTRALNLGPSCIVFETNNDREGKAQLDFFRSAGAVCAPLGCAGDDLTNGLRQVFVITPP